ncbi:hypothetical protein SR1949_48210 [Sphaerospermopsis reniformis]|uniref:Uncharacterized protein n=1 Tax=Sphaerospermopsis reniformis TaxID=531300 RepID=A0A480A7K6_9CYAN|nr:hypothetical protein SR1949_48210 [Sphaerospermopsis reniformis]
MSGWGSEKLSKVMGFCTATITFLPSNCEKREFKRLTQDACFLPIGDISIISPLINSTLSSSVKIPAAFI